MRRAFLISVVTGLVMTKVLTGQVQVPTTVQLPTFGVSIDADGVLTSRMYAEPGGKLFAERILAARRSRDAEWLETSRLRKVSLRRLEEAIAKRVHDGEAPDEAMQHLAGLTRILYVFVMPDERDVIIAGPAEPWIEDASDRAVGIESGRPTVLLEDLVTALRAFAPNQRRDIWVGCTIDPNARGLERLVEFQRTIPRAIPERGRERVGQQIAAGMRESLGLADIRVFGVSPKTHLAHVLVEADYRMKLIGIGLEPPPVQMMTFIGATRNAQHQVLQRWWFTPDPKSVRVTDDHLSMEIVGQSVQLLSEEYGIDGQGRLQQRNQPASRASQLFTKAFTSKYEQIAAQSPVYAQLRNMVDVLVIAAYLNRFEGYERSGWTPTLWLDEAQFPVETHADPQKTPCAANAVWKGNRLLASAGGGVSILPTDSLKEEHLVDDPRDELGTARQTIRFDGDRWWWD